MDLGLRSRAALVTGGSGDLGRAMALHLAREGAQVAVCGRTKSTLEAVVAEICAENGLARSVVADLATYEGCQAAVTETREVFGRLDILVANARVQARAADWAVAEDEPLLVDRLMGKALAACRCSRAAARVLTPGGRIIFIGGLSARTPLNRYTFGSGFITVGDELSTYAQGMSNAALASYTKHLSDALGPRQITVNIVHPGPSISRSLAGVRSSTPDLDEAALATAIPTGRFTTPDDVASLVTFLSSSLSSNITGQSIAVDGGLARGTSYLTSLNS